jgi:LPXTG-motif cell wall-anchored protein
MNVRFPGFDTSEDWWVIIGVMIGLLVGVLGFFRYKKFF